MDLDGIIELKDIVIELFIPLMLFECFVLFNIVLFGALLGWW